MTDTMTETATGTITAPAQTWDPPCVRRVLELFSERNGGAPRADLTWRFGDDDGIEFAVICTDFFGWSEADSETLEPGDLDDLQAAITDAGPALGHRLWIARKRRLRPQGAAYRTIPADIWRLFDACGPVRAIDYLNPFPQPSMAPGFFSIIGPGRRPVGTAIPASMHQALNVRGDGADFSVVFEAGRPVVLRVPDAIIDGDRCAKIGFFSARGALQWETCPMHVSPSGTLRLDGVRIVDGS